MQNHLDGFYDLRPPRSRFTKSLSPFAPHAINNPAAAVAFLAAARQRAFGFQPVEQGVDAPLSELHLMVGRQRNLPHQFVTVHRLAIQQTQDQELRDPVQKIRICASSGHWSCLPCLASRGSDPWSDVRRSACGMITLWFEVMQDQLPHGEARGVSVSAEFNATDRGTGPPRVTVAAHGCACPHPISYHES